MSDAFKEPYISDQDKRLVYLYRSYDYLYRSGLYTEIEKKLIKSFLISFEVGFPEIMTNRVVMDKRDRLLNEEE